MPYSPIYVVYVSVAFVSVRFSLQEVFAEPQVEIGNICIPILISLDSILEANDLAMTPCIYYFVLVVPILTNAVGSGVFLITNNFLFMASVIFFVSIFTKNDSNRLRHVYLLFINDISLFCL